MSKKKTEVKREEVDAVLNLFKACLEAGKYGEILDRIYPNRKKPREERILQLEENVPYYLKLIDAALECKRGSGSVFPGEYNIALYKLGAGDAEQFEIINDEFPQFWWVFKRDKEGILRSEILPDSRSAKRLRKARKDPKNLVMAAETGLAPEICAEIRRLRGKVVEVDDVPAELPKPLASMLYRIKFSTGSRFSGEDEYTGMYVSDFQFWEDGLDTDQLGVYGEFYGKRLAYLGCDNYYLAGIPIDSEDADPELYWIDHEWSEKNQALSECRLWDFLSTIRKQK